MEKQFKKETLERYHKIFKDDKNPNMVLEQVVKQVYRAATQQQ